MMYWNSGHMGGWAFSVITVGMVLFWILVIIGIFLLARYLLDGGRRTAMPPEQVLADRVARGEIDIDEFRARSSALRNAKS